MRKPCGVLITAAKGLPAKVTLGNGDSFLPAGCQQEQQSSPCSRMQQLLGKRIPLPHPQGSSGNTSTHIFTPPAWSKRSYRATDKSTLCSWRWKSPFPARWLIPRFSASRHFWSHFWVRNYLPELNLSRFLLLSACIEPLQISLWAKIKSESGKSWCKIIFSIQRIFFSSDN